MIAALLPGYRAAVAAAVEVEELFLKLAALTGPPVPDHLMAEVHRRHRTPSVPVPDPAAPGVVDLRTPTLAEAVRSVLDDVTRGALS